MSDRSIYLQDANGTLYLAEPAGVFDFPGSAELHRLTIEAPGRRGDATQVYAFSPGMHPPGRVVFHLAGSGEIEGGLCKLDPRNRRWVNRSACGRLAWLGHCLDHDVNEPHMGCRARDIATWMRRDHAELLGRLCEVCARAEATR